MQGSKITEKILKEAEEQARKILEEAEKEAASILDDAEKEKTFILESARKEAEEAYEKEKEKRVGLELIELRKKVLQARREIIDRALKEAVKKLEEESREDYLNHMSNFIKALGLNGSFDVIPGKSEDRVDEAFVGELSKRAGIDLQLVKGEVTIKKGFLLRSGRLEINLEPSVIVPTLKDELEDHLKGLLIGE